MWEEGKDFIQHSGSVGNAALPDSPSHLTDTIRDVLHSKPIVLEICAQRGEKINSNGMKQIYRSHD
jgi:hypothetical protein